jgi:hypothetical protein
MVVYPATAVTADGISPDGGNSMRWLRFSFAGVMAFILYAAIGFAAFAKVDDPWYGRVFDEPA